MDVAVHCNFWLESSEAECITLYYFCKKFYWEALHFTLEFGMTFELNMITISFSTLCPLVLWCILFFLIIFYFVPITAVVVWNNIDECSDNVYILVIGMSSIVTLWLWFFQKEEGFIFVNILHEKKKVLTVKIVFCLVIPRCIERALSNYWCFFYHLPCLVTTALYLCQTLSDKHFLNICLFSEW